MRHCSTQQFLTRWFKMDNFIFDFDDFSTIFPEFSDAFPESLIRAKLNVVKLLYCGLFVITPGDTDQEALRKELIYLALAHLLTLESSPYLAVGGKLKTIKNRQDSVTFAVNDSDTVYSLSNTMYGQILEQKIAAMSAGGFVSKGSDLGVLVEEDDYDW